MIIKINEEMEIEVEVVSEKIFSLSEEKFMGLSFSIVNSSIEITDIFDKLKNISKLILTRTDEDGIQTEVDFSKYKELFKLDRKITDTLDSLQVVLKGK